MLWLVSYTSIAVTLMARRRKSRSRIALPAATRGRSAALRDKSGRTASAMTSEPAMPATRHLTPGHPRLRAWWLAQPRRRSSPRRGPAGGVDQLRCPYGLSPIH